MLRIAAELDTVEDQNGQRARELNNRLDAKLRLLFALNEQSLELMGDDAQDKGG